MRVCGCVCVRTYARLRIWKWITRKMDPTTSSNKPTPTPLNSPNFTHSHTQNWTGHAFVVRPNVFKEDHAGYMEEVFRINWTIRQERPHSSNHSQELRPLKKSKPSQTLSTHPPTFRRVARPSLTGSRTTRELCAYVTTHSSSETVCTLLRGLRQSAIACVFEFFWFVFGYTRVRDC